MNEDVTANPEPIQYENDGVSKYKLKLKKAVKYARQCESEVKAFAQIKWRLSKKIRNMRYFWKDKIYGEGARSGKILKAAMQGSSVKTILACLTLSTCSYIIDSFNTTYIKCMI